MPSVGDRTVNPLGARGTADDHALQLILRNIALAETPSATIRHTYSDTYVPHHSTAAQARITPILNLDPAESILGNLAIFQHSRGACSEVHGQLRVRDVL